jgi:RNA polymerase sigma factor (sigma-70 family)
MSSSSTTRAPAETQAEQADHSCRRLRELTRKLLRRYPPVRGRDSLEESLQEAVSRLRLALSAARPASRLEYVSLASRHIRRELAEAVRQYRAGQGPGAILPTQEHAPAGTRPDGAPPPTSEPGRFAAWLAFHTKVDELGDEARQIFDFLWYHAVPVHETARCLGIDERTLHQRWQQARLQLYELLAGQLPPDD